ncbi:MAG: hypothetical protein IJO67_03745 [Clostridia bacterium]|nr:hypothetical protein [Clostridia bacterium]
MKKSPLMARRNRTPGSGRLLINQVSGKTAIKKTDPAAQMIKKPALKKMVFAVMQKKKTATKKMGSARMISVKMTLRAAVV